MPKENPSACLLPLDVILGRHDKDEWWLSYCDLKGMTRDADLSHGVTGLTNSGITKVQISCRVRLYNVFIF